MARTVLFHCPLGTEPGPRAMQAQDILQDNDIDILAAVVLY